MTEDFRQKDPITGRKLHNPLNSKNLQGYELDEIMMDDDPEQLEEWSEEEIWDIDSADAYSEREEE